MHDPESPSPPESRGTRAGDAESEVRRVQVVARWNHWVKVRDPLDGSERWIDLDRAAYARV